MLRCTMALCVLGLFSAIPAAMAGAAPPQKQGPTNPGPVTIDGYLLAEPYVGTVSKDGGTVIVQDMTQWGNQWDHNSQCFWEAKNGASLSVPILLGVNADAEYVCQVAFTKSYDYGQVQLSVNGKPVGAAFDGFAPKVTYGGLVTLGTTTLLKGPAWNQICLTVTGKNKDSKNFYVGIDVIKFTPVTFKLPPGGLHLKEVPFQFLKKQP